MLSVVSTQMLAQFNDDPRVQALKDAGVEMDFSGLRMNADGVNNQVRHRLTLDSISVEPEQRGKGLGAQTMAILIELADQHDVVLDLEVGFDDAEIGLVQWYQRLGFEWKDGFMERSPLTTIMNPIDRGFHVTTRDALDEILESGLQPRIGPRSKLGSESAPAIYLFASREDTENGLMNWLGECFDDDEELVVIEVDLVGVPQKRKSDHFEVIVTENIPSERIAFVYDENFKKMRTSLQP